MTKSKKWFLFGFVVFFALLGYASYDISRRTTFPGSKSQLKKRLQQQYQVADTVQLDSANKPLKE